jgi:hypothetical protein
MTCNLDRILRTYIVDTVKQNDIFTIQTYSKREAYCLGRMECWKQGKKFIRIAPVRTKKVA